MLGAPQFRNSFEYPTNQRPVVFFKFAFIEKVSQGHDGVILELRHDRDVDVG